MSIASHRENPFAIAYVEAIVDTMLTIPLGIFNKALSFELYPNPRIKMAENVVITPLGIVMRIVNKTSSQVCMSAKASRTDRQRKTLSPTPA
jgi:hypothetical protein